MGERLSVIGAGPAGLAAAIVAARSGRRVVVHERNGTVGARFHNDYQGLENWTTTSDVLDELASVGVAGGFEAVPFREQVAFGPDGRSHLFRSDEPFFYLVRRGPGPGTLDDALQRAALDAGVEIRFKSSPAGSHGAKGAKGATIDAHGPRGVFAVAHGCVFETDLRDSSYGLMDDRLAPGGYGYLLVANGWATLAVCIFHEFPSVKRCFDRVAAYFEERVGFRVGRGQQFGGFGNISVPIWRGPGQGLVAGEAGGVQDALWGFGIRYAVNSGILAGRLAAGESERDLRRLWRDRIARSVRASFVNRYLYRRLGHLGYNYLLRQLDRSPDPRAVLRRLYAPSRWKLMLAPAARRLLGVPAQQLAG